MCAAISFVPSPPESHHLSPFNSARLLNTPIKDLTKQWTEGALDNFLYLCLLNRLGNRSLVDFSQYFIFPWLINDFSADFLEVPEDVYRDLGKPIGQIGSGRLERFDSMFEDSNSEYFYGSYYMHLGAVLYILVRIDPFLLFSLYLHHGWDHPNRMFFDTAEAWLSVAHRSLPEVREFVPQLLDVPEILTDVNKLPLTVTTDGRPVAPSHARQVGRLVSLPGPLHDDAEAHPRGRTCFSEFEQMDRPHLRSQVQRKGCY
jgi:hypothetical protein